MTMPRRRCYKHDRQLNWQQMQHEQRKIQTARLFGREKIDNSIFSQVSYTHIPARIWVRNSAAWQKLTVLVTRVQQSADLFGDSSSTVHKGSSARRSSDDGDNHSCRMTLSSEDNGARSNNTADDWWRSGPSSQISILTPLDQTKPDRRFSALSSTRPLLALPDCLTNERITITHTVAAQRLTTVTT